MTRYTYLPKIFKSKYPWIKFSRVDSTEFYDKGIVKSNFNVITILKILNAILENHKIGFVKLYTKSRIKFKKSFLNYLNFLLQLKMINKTTQKGKGNPVNYSLTQKGITFLEIFA